MVAFHTVDLKKKKKTLELMVKPYDESFRGASQ